MMNYVKWMRQWFEISNVFDGLTCIKPQLDDPRCAGSGLDPGVTVSFDQGCVREILRPLFELLGSRKNTVDFMGLVWDKPSTGDLLQDFAMIHHDPPQLLKVG